MAGDLPPWGTVRAGESIVDLPAATDAGLYFIGRIRTPWTDPMDCPKQGDRTVGPDCRIEIDARWQPLLARVADRPVLQIIYWLHLARRDLAMQTPRNDGRVCGTFSLRSPLRPNPLGISSVHLVGVDATGLTVRGLDCVDGTPLIDLKPDPSIWEPMT